MARRAKDTISSPMGTVVRDEIPRNFQPKFLAECIKKEMFYDDGNDDQDEPELEIGDALDGYSRELLVQMISLNQLPVVPMRKWSDGQLRQAIREVSPIPVDKLRTGPDRSSEVDMATGITTPPPQK